MQKNFTLLRHKDFNFNGILYDYVDSINIVFTTLRCPKCNHINKKLSFYDFSKYEDTDWLELFETDNEIEVAFDSHTIRCKKCKKFFQIIFPESDIEQLKIVLLKNQKN